MEYELLKIGELAGMTGVTVKALYIYEKKKIIIPAKTDEETGYRYYHPDQVKQVEALLELQDLGFSLNDIEKIMSGHYSNEEVLLIIDAKKKEWQEKIWKAEAKMSELETMAKRIGFDDKNDNPKKMTDEERAWYLAKLVCINENNVKQTISEAIWL